MFWDWIRQRYGQKNGPLLYQLQREICTISQGSSIVEAYFTRLMKLQDEYFSCLPTSLCHCEGKQQTDERNSFTCVIQHLMGLNDSFDQVRNQILVMEPLPTIDRVYSMLLSVERQREIHVLYPDRTETTAMYARQQSFESERKMG